MRPPFSIRADNPSIGIEKLYPPGAVAKRSHHVFWDLHQEIPGRSRFAYPIHKTRRLFWDLEILGLVFVVAIRSLHQQSFISPIWVRLRQKYRFRSCENGGQMIVGFPGEIGGVF